MKIFVCIKQVPDSEAKLKLKADSSGVDFAGIKWVMNPYDEFAVEEALKMKEAGKAANVTVLTVGPKARAVDVLRTALAMGADDAIVIDAPEDVDAFVAAKALAAAIKAEGDFRFVLAGKQALDDNAAAVPQMLAEFLDVPHASVVSKIEVSDAGAICEREVEGGTREILRLQGPMVVSANKGLNLPRYASLPGIMKAKKKPVKELDLAGLGVSASEAKIRFKAFALPPEKPAVKILSGDPGQQISELARLLRNEAKVL
jgi:electron transfer flavoprotein beta subunit